MRRLGMVLALGMTIGLVAVAPPALATYPGTNGMIAFSTDFGRNPQIFTVKPDGSKETQITFGADGHATNPDWSPDGTKIAFQGDATGEIQIYVMNPDGSGRQQLTFEPGVDHLPPRISPDGTHIIFSDNCCLPRSNIWVMNADGSGLQQLTHAPPGGSAAFAGYSPDGTKIVFLGSASDDRYTMNADGTHFARIVDDQPGG